MNASDRRTITLAIQHETYEARHADYLADQTRHRHRRDILRELLTHLDIAAQKQRNAKKKPTSSGGDRAAGKQTFKTDPEDFEQQENRLSKPTRSSSNRS